jgi:hypothetical protein
MTATRRRIIYALLLAVAFAALVSAFLLTPEPDPPDRPVDVLAVSPEENANEVRQATVFAELGGDVDAALIINNKEIPDDQVDRLQTGNLRIAFVPGEGKEFERLPGGRTCARVEYWPRGQVRENTSKAYAWCFNLQ